MMGGSMQPPDTIAVYEESLVSLWERLVTTLGIHTVRVLLARLLGREMAHQTCTDHPNLEPLLVCTMRGRATCAPDRGRAAGG